MFFSRNVLSIYGSYCKLAVFRCFVNTDSTVWRIIITSRFISYSIKTILVLFFLSSNIYAADIVELSSHIEKVDLTPNVSLSLNKYQENGNHFLIPEKFSELKDKVIKQGYSKDVLFLKVILTNTENTELTKILYFDHLLTGNIDLMIGEQFLIGGSSVPKSKRNVDSVYTAFKLKFKPYETKDIIIRKYGHHVLNSKLYVTSEFEFYKLNVDKLNIFKVYAGAILALFVYNLFIAVFTRSKLYFTYCGYLGALFLTVVGSQGVVDILDIFENITLSHYLIIFSSSSLIAAWYFTRRFLNTDEHLPWFKYVVRFGTILALIPILYAFSPWFNSGAWLFGNYIDVLIPIGIILCIVAGVKVAFKKEVLGYIYLVSWSFLFLGAFMYLGSVHGLLGRGFIYNNGLLFGNIFEMLVLSLGLGYQIITLNKEKNEALEKAKVKEKLQRLIRVLSHDIANSLQVAILNLKRGQRHSEGKGLKCVTEALKASDNITDILNHVRAEQRLEDVKESIVCSKISLKNCLNKVIFLFDEKLQNKKIQLINETNDEDLLIAEETSFVNNVLGNILSNCIKFSPENGKIIIKSKKDHNKIIIEITDEGEGFPIDIINNFNKKEQITSYLGTAGESGTGFGLRIIETYMSLYKDGTMEILNDKGAIYRLSLSLS